MDMTIRAATRADYAAIADIFDHPLVVANSSQHPYLGSERVTKIFDGQSENMVLLVAETEGKVAGYLRIGITSKPREKHVATLAMAVHPNYHGKGIGSRLLNEAIDLVDNWLNIVRFELDVYTDNEIAIALYKKYGFELEGELKYASFKQGAYVGIYKMARINPGLKQ